MHSYPGLSRFTNDELLDCVLYRDGDISKCAMIEWNRRQEIRNRERSTRIAIFPSGFTIPIEYALTELAKVPDANAPYSRFPGALVRNSNLSLDLRNFLFGPIADGPLVSYLIA